MNNSFTNEYNSVNNNYSSNYNNFNNNSNNINNKDLNCLSCGFENNDGSKFYLSCGSELNENEISQTKKVF